MSSDLSALIATIAGVLHESGVRLSGHADEFGLPLLKVPGSDGLVHADEVVRQVIMGAIAKALVQLEKNEKARTVGGGMTIGGTSARSESGSSH